MMSESRNLEGRILDIDYVDDGMPIVKLDNGPVRVINIATTLDKVDALILEDTTALHRHLMTKGKDRFRVKRGDK